MLKISGEPVACHCGGIPGDNGGPVTWKNPDGRLYLIGILADHLPSPPLPRV